MHAWYTRAYDPWINWYSDNHEFFCEGFVFFCSFFVIRCTLSSLSEVTNSNLVQVVCGLLYVCAERFGSDALHCTHDTGFCNRFLRSDTTRALALLDHFVLCVVERFCELDVNFCQWANISINFRFMSIRFVFAVRTLFQAPWNSQFWHQEIFCEYCTRQMECVGIESCTRRRGTHYIFFFQMFFVYVLLRSSVTWKLSFFQTFLPFCMP